MPIDLRKIRPYRGSQNQGFEELVCQMARRTIAAGDKTWRRLDGAGGDGGVEAYYDSPRGRVGLQAKYFTRTADIGWTQIRDSFRTALANHPTLTTYRVYLACDLTGPTSRSTRTGTERWAELEQEMETQARMVNRNIDVLLVTASDILGEIARAECVGLSDLWFGALEITPTRLTNWLDAAVDALGDRYHPEDHVEVGAQQVARVLSRSPRVVTELQQYLAALSTLEPLSPPEQWSQDAAVVEKVSQAETARRLVLTLDEDLVENADVWPVGVWRQNLLEAREAIGELLHLTYTDSRRSTASDGVGYFRHTLDKHYGALESLRKFLSTTAFDAEPDRVGVVTGPAGSGKSHLLASCASDILANGGVCVLLLGQRFRDDQLWPQIVAQLGLPGTISVPQFLGALDATALAARQRGLLLIDAVNEGALRRIWRLEFDAFANQIRAFPNLALIVSCRDVFVAQVLGEDVGRRYSVTTIRGFAAASEQERAAQIYMDRRGITQPAVPWLAPEFINPLFLRSCCDALAADGQHEFPAGLIGTKRLLDFYVTALSRSLDQEIDSSGNVAILCKQALVAIGRRMADQRRDWLERIDTVALVSVAFAGYGGPGTDWTAALLRCGILREDPHPGKRPADPLSEQPDVIRFAFQRFQDHLMAETLLANVTEIETAFAPDAVFGFLFLSNGELAWEWNGLVEALSIQVPETFNKEFVDVLHGGADRHWHDYTIQQAFAASVQWREPIKVSDRALELANSLHDNPSAIVSLLIELSPRVDHPWNARFLDNQLRRWEDWKRDRDFMRVISQDGVYEEHSVNRLVDWCARAPKAKADPDALRLCALALCWLCGSLAPILRDRATKALASIFTDAPALFPELIAQFSSVTDLYVVERLLAAGYGMLLRHGDSERAHDAATAVLEHIFARTPVPEDILLRDYAAGIVEFAASRDALPAAADLASSEPPYGSPAPRLKLAQADVEALADKAGDREILRSSTSDMSDFYKNDIRYRVEAFIKVRLTRTVKPSNRQLAFQFEENLKLQLDGAKWRALNRLSRLLWSRRTVLVSIAGIDTIQPSQPPATPLQIRDAETTLLALLTPLEAQAYRKPWLPQQLGTTAEFREAPRPSAAAGGLWIAREAYRMGWTAKRFGNDGGHGGYYSHERPTVETVGKKYQWLARSKLLCRLADNYWLAEDFQDSGPKHYGYATDIGFERDVDPCLYDHPTHSDGGGFGARRGLAAPLPVIDDRDNDERLAWPHEFSFETGNVDDPFIVDNSGGRWCRLSWFVSVNRSAERHRTRALHGLLQREFRFTHAVLCEPAHAASLQRDLRARGHIDVRDWDPIEYTDGPFLYEYWRGTWPSCRWRAVTDWREGAAFRVAFPVEEYRWESHLDRSMPEGARGQVLAPWIMDEERLRLSPHCPDLIESAAGETIGWRGQERNNSGFVVHQDWFFDFLRRANLACVWITVGEREAWDEDGDDGATVVRRFNSIIRLVDRRAITERWYEDTDWRVRSS